MLCMAFQCPSSCLAESEVPSSSSPQADMLTESPERLAKTAASLLKDAEGCERDSEGRPSEQAVQLALQACLSYLHQAAVLKEKNLPGKVLYGL